MLVIFIVDSRGQCEARARFEHDAIMAHAELLDRVSLLEAQAAATELALRELADDPSNPNLAAKKARAILAVLEG